MSFVAEKAIKGRQQTATSPSFLDPRSGECTCPLCIGHKNPKPITSARPKPADDFAIWRSSPADIAPTGLGQC